MKEDLPSRKNMRRKGFDYDNAGAYFVTICTKNRRNILSTVVGDGALDVPEIKLTRIGEIVEKYILTTSNIKNVFVDRYVIMPNHIHIMLFVQPPAQDGTSRAPSPTNKMLPGIVGGLKRLCGRELGENVFQRSYYDHVIRDRKDYETHKKYICENPFRWHEDDLYSVE